MRAASYSFPPTNCLPAPPSVICSEIILTVPYMGLGALELKLMGKYPFHLTQKMNARLRAMPRSHRQTETRGGASNALDMLRATFEPSSLLDGQKIKKK